MDEQSKSAPGATLGESLDRIQAEQVELGRALERCKELEQELTAKEQERGRALERCKELEQELTAKEQERGRALERCKELEQELELLAPADERGRRAEWMRRRLAELEIAPVPRGGRRLTEEERRAKAAEEYERALARHRARGTASRRVAR